MSRTRKRFFFSHPRTPSLPLSIPLEVIEKCDKTGQKTFSSFSCNHNTTKQTMNVFFVSTIPLRLVSQSGDIVFSA